MKNHEYTTTELAMRQFLYVQQHVHGDSWTKVELVEALMEKFSISRPTAYRAVSFAVDILAVHYEMNAKRLGKIRDKHSQTIMRKRSRGQSPMQYADK